MTAYYNEFDKEKAVWLCELIKAGLIAPGDVDERGIEDVDAADLLGYRQCHFFAGIGIWSYALRLAGWPDNRPVWTGSCPCPSFSAAGKGAGFDDPRHLWPHWARLIGKRKPPVVFGEQVDDAIGFGWLDLVQTDMEAEAYSVGKAVLGACSVGAPHIRQRLYFVALGDAERSGRHRWTLDAERGPEGRTATTGAGEDDELADSQGGRLGAGFRNREQAGERGTLVADGCNDGFVGSPTSGGLAMRGGAQGDSGRAALASGTIHMGIAAGEGLSHGEPQELPGSRRGSQGRAVAEPSEAPCGMAHSECRTAERQRFDMGTTPRGIEVGGQERQRLWDDTRPSEFTDNGCGRPGPVNGFWRDADWIRCRDALWRPVRPGTLPLVTGASARVVRLRGYGDGLCSETAKAFIESVMEVIG